MSDELVVIVVFAPQTHADAIRRAADEAGGGAIGAYRACSFTSPGQGRFVPVEGANPTIGEVGQLETVEEARIELVCPRPRARQALDAMLAAHPYEVPAYHVYATIDRANL